LRAGLEWRNALSALNEMLNRIVSLETQLKNTQQVLRDNAAADTAAAAPVIRHGRDLGRKLKELKDSLYNSELQRDAGQAECNYHDNIPFVRGASCRARRAVTRERRREAQYRSVTLVAFVLAPGRPVAVLRAAQPGV